MQLFKGFEEFSVLNQTGTAAMIDYFPILRWLPDFVLRTQAYARRLHREEKDSFSGSLTHGQGRDSEWNGFSMLLCGYDKDPRETRVQRRTCRL
jgi:hypothetical protein